MTTGRQYSEDEAHMLRAIELAQRGWGRVAPNPLVGAVIVRDGQIVGEGWHREFGREHAEVAALADAGEAARGATLYVTLEPCSHHGKTGPCTEAILRAGVSRVVFACADPNPVAGGGGEALRAAGVSVDSGTGEDAAHRINGPYFRSNLPDAPPRPWTELKLAISIDGKTADRDGTSHWITGDSARAEVHRLRAGHDAIAVGIGTALADDPMLTVRGEIEPRQPPARIVFDRSLRLPLESRLVRSANETPLWVVTGPNPPAAPRDRLEARGAKVVPAADLHDALRILFEEGIGSIFCEGGATFASTLLREDLVDRLTLIRAPFFLGPDAPDPFRAIPSSPLADAHRWRLIRSLPFDDDTLVTLER